MRRFLEENTPLVFGIAFADIDMAEVIPQQPVADKVRQANAAAGSGDLVEAMDLLSDMTGQQERRAPQEYAPTADDFGFCREFVVTAAMGSRSTRHEAPAPYCECWCRDSPARPPGRRCPKLGQEDHGVWYAQGEAPATQMAAACASAPSRPSNSSESRPAESHGALTCANALSASR